MELNPQDEDLLKDIIIENRQAIEMSETYINVLSAFMYPQGSHKQQFKNHNEKADNNYRNNIYTFDFDTFFKYECAFTIC